MGWCSRRSYENEAVRGVGHEKFCRKRMMKLLGLPRSRRHGNTYVCGFVAPVVNLSMH